MAYVEATVASILRRMEADIDGEIQLTEDEPDEDYSSLRRAVLAAYKQLYDDSSDSLPDDEEDEDDEDDETPLRVECDDLDEWKGAIDLLETQVFWDYDFDLDVFDDMPPQQSGQLKSQHGILDDYFSAVPEDPKPKEALKLLKETRKLCDKVIKREEKKLKTSGP